MSEISPNEHFELLDIERKHNTSRRYALKSELFAVMQAIGTEMAERLAMLEAQIKLAQQQQMKYAGVWSAGQYDENAVVTDKSTIWIAKRATASRPGSDDSWQLMVKSPRGAR